eukprot:c732_g1_i1.p1 GENE.c732_g1_i1~~c732_g1_i1.p1  ORF type:complete len:399 (+),score=76.56 c732_g1_i1:42-1199(+)
MDTEKEVMATTNLRGKTCVLRVKWLDAGGMHVDLMCGALAWSGKCSRKQVEEMMLAQGGGDDDSQPRCSRHEFISQTNHCFHVGSFELDQSTSDSACLDLSWEHVPAPKPHGSPNTTTATTSLDSIAVVGCMELAPAESGHIFSKIISGLFDERRRMLDVVDELETARTGMRRTCAQSKTECDNALRARHRLEGNLLSQFFPVLTAKRIRAGQLSLQIESLQKSVDQLSAKLTSEMALHPELESDDSDQELLANTDDSDDDNNNNKGSSDSESDHTSSSRRSARSQTGAASSSSSHHQQHQHQHHLKPANAPLLNVPTPPSSVSPSGFSSPNQVPQRSPSPAPVPSPPPPPRRSPNALLIDDDALAFDSLHDDPGLSRPSKRSRR